MMMILMHGFRPSVWQKTESWEGSHPMEWKDVARAYAMHPLMHWDKIASEQAFQRKPCGLASSMAWKTSRKVSLLGYTKMPSPWEDLVGVGNCSRWGKSSVWLAPRGYWWCCSYQEEDQRSQNLPESHRVVSRVRARCIAFGGSWGWEVSLDFSSLSHHDAAVHWNVNKTTKDDYHDPDDARSRPTRNDQ